MKSSAEIAGQSTENDVMFGKFFASTFTGSMAGAGPEIFAVWAYAIANTNATSYVEINPVVVAPLIGTSVKKVEKAVEFLCSPDSKSRSKEENGRRMVKEGEFLYRVVNHSRYRAIKDENERTQYMRDYMRKYRNANVNLDVNSSKHALTPPSSSVSVSSSELGGVQGGIIAQKQKFQIDQRFKWLEAELCAFYHRPRSQVGVGEEQVLVAEVARRMDVKTEWATIKAYRGQIEARYFPQSLASLCRDWEKTLDRARNHETPKSELSIIEKDIEAITRKALKATENYVNES